MKRCIVICAVIILILGVAWTSSRPTSSAARRTNHCVKYDLTYSAKRVTPAQIFGYDERLQNCSAQAETIRVTITAKGHGEFPHPSAATYTLKPDQGIDQHAMIVAPTRLGHYAITATFSVNTTIFARSHTRFTVVRKD